MPELKKIADPIAAALRALDEREAEIIARGPEIDKRIEALRRERAGLDADRAKVTAARRALIDFQTPNDPMNILRFTGMSGPTGPLGPPGAGLTILGSATFEVGNRTKTQVGSPSAMVDVTPTMAIVSALRNKPGLTRRELVEALVARGVSKAADPKNALMTRVNQLMTGHDPRIIDRNGLLFLIEP